jgi:hypothetical protein
LSVNDHPHSGWLGFPPRAEKQKHESASVVAFVIASKARGQKQTIIRILPSFPLRKENLRARFQQRIK